MPETTLQNGNGHVISGSSVKNLAFPMFLNSYPSSSLNNLIWTMPATSAVFPSMNGHNTMARFKCSILHQQSFTRQVMSAASMACSASIFIVLPSGEIKHLVSTVSL